MIKYIKEHKIKIVIFTIISILICSSFLFYNECEYFINNLFYPIPIKNTIACETRVHFIDVGQGDSILIELPDNKTMLIDAGPSNNESDLLQYLEKVFINKQEKVIDYFVFSHPDEDHIGGADKIFDNYTVKCCVRPSVFTNEEVIEYGFQDVEINTEPHFVEAINKMYEEQCQNIISFATDNILNLSSSCGYSIKFLSPLAERYTNSNDYSSVIMYEYNNRKFLFTGDASSQIEEDLVTLYKDELKADVLKVAHHGSKDSTSLEFLKYVKPNIAVIPVGLNNSYNHPTEETLTRLSACVSNKSLFRTDINGNIIIGIDNDLEFNKNIIIETQKNHIIDIHINWWCVILFLEAIVFIIVFSKKQKNVKA